MEGGLGRKGVDRGAWACDYTGVQWIKGGGTGGVVGAERDGGVAVGEVREAPAWVRGRVAGRGVRLSEKTLCG